MSYDVFISHASENKDFCRRLAKALQDRGLRVWFDEFELRVGASLRRAIDLGLATSRFGLVVLSKEFFAKEWPQKELDALVSRESDRRRVILPIWHGVTAEDVRAFSPMLADRVALPTTRPLSQIVDEICLVLGPALAEKIEDAKATRGVTRRLQENIPLRSMERYGLTNAVIEALAAEQGIRNVLMDVTEDWQMRCPYCGTWQEARAGVDCVNKNCGAFLFCSNVRGHPGKVATYALERQPAMHR